MNKSKKKKGKRKRGCVFATKIRRQGERIDMGAIRNVVKCHVKVKVTQSCLTATQARILEWVAVPFSRGSFQPRVPTQVFRIAGGFFTS